MGNWKIIYESENGKITVFKGEDLVADAARQAETGQL